MQGEFSVLKGYGNDQAAALYSVSSHHKAKGQDHILYAVNVRKYRWSCLMILIKGVDNEGPFEIFRRYKEFFLLRNVLCERFPGLYVPPIPPKRVVCKTEIWLMLIFRTTRMKILLRKGNIYLTCSLNRFAIAHISMNLMSWNYLSGPI